MAAMWGRNIYQNVRKFIQFQLSVNIVCLTITFLGGITLGNPTFSVTQLLWINMIMDTLAAISLATEPPHPEDLKSQRQEKDEKIISPAMWRNIVSQVTYQLVVLIVMLYTVPWWFGKGYNLVNNSGIDFYGQLPNESADVTVDRIHKLEHYTVIFHTFVLMNLFNQFNSRKLGWKDLNIFNGFFNNFKFLLIVLIEFGFQYGIVQFGGQIFRTSPLDWRQHLTCFMFGLGSIFVGIGSKFIPEKEVGRFSYNFNERDSDENGILSRLSQL